MMEVLRNRRNTELSLDLAGRPPVIKFSSNQVRSSSGSPVLCCSPTTPRPQELLKELELELELQVQLGTELQLQLVSFPY